MTKCGAIRDVGTVQRTKNAFFSDENTSSLKPIKVALNIILTSKMPLLFPEHMYIQVVKTEALFKPMVPFFSKHSDNKS